MSENTTGFEDVYGEAASGAEKEEIEQLKLFTVRDEPEDVWQGLPEFEQRDLTPWRVVTVQFRSEADFLEFKKKIGADKKRQAGGLNSHNFWYPPIEPFVWKEKEWATAPEGVGALDSADSIPALLDIKPKDSLIGFLDLISEHSPSADTALLKDLAIGQIKGEMASPLEGRWYDSIYRGAPDYTIYADDLYIAEAWHCWASYSRKYLRFIRDNRADLFSGVRSVLDLGCGFGYTTRALKEVFKNAEVTGTQLSGTLQSQVATRIGKEFDFTIVDSAEEAGAADLLFASEYFEHIEAPIAHLVDVLNIANPRIIVVANAFGTRAAGHFIEYKYGAERVSGKKAAGIFRDTLRARGYRAAKTNAWNNRPRVWVREEGAR